jgi:hypothetical protein
MMNNSNSSSPFPGMDPWLESAANFPHFHQMFIATLTRDLSERLPAGFYAKTGTRIWLEHSSRSIVPDVSVGQAFASKSSSTQVAYETSSGDLLELEIAEPDWERTESYIDVLTTSHQLVASIEVLSPANKQPGSKGREQYRTKQQELMRTGAHTLEIDLLRDGKHATLVDETELQTRFGPYDYHVCLHRGDRPARMFVKPFRVQDALPQVLLPLTADAPGILLDLQTCFQQSYAAAGFARFVDYQDLTAANLTPEQAAWAQNLLRTKGVPHA